MGAVADWRRVRRLGRYLVRDRRRLLVALLLLVPLAFAGALQPVLLGQVRGRARCEDLPELYDLTFINYKLCRGFSASPHSRMV